MTGFRRRVAAPLLATAFVVFCLAPSCAEQGEGERCDKSANGDDDCESGLECIEANDLANASFGDRCCPPEEVSDDERCIRKTGGTGGSAGTAGSSGSAGADGSADAAGGSAGTAGSSGAAGSGGTSTDGGPCHYTSQCPLGLVCGPGGVCQHECKDTLDCTPPLVCSGGKCQTAVPDASSD